MRFTRTEKWDFPHAIADKREFAICSEGLIKKDDPKLELREPPEWEQMLLCVNFIEDWCRPRAAIDGSRSSYWWKHVVEKWFEPGVTRAKRLYASNGAFIWAASEMGYRMRPSLPNAHLAMDFKEPNKWRML